MNEFSISTEQDIESLNKLIINFNLAKVPFPTNPPWKPLSFVLKDKEELLAGVYGYLIMNNIISIDVLYVKETLRHQGYGTQLLATIEKEAKAQGAYLAQLDTFGFQGLDFYIKSNYQIFGTLEDSPAPGHTRYYLSKRL